MTVTLPAGRVRTMDKSVARKLIESVDLRLGIDPDESATADRSRKLSLACGIKPGDNEFSREIIRLRNGYDPGMEAD